MEQQQPIRLPLTLHQPVVEEEVVVENMFLPKIQTHMISERKLEST